MNLRIHLPHHQSSAHAIKPKGQAMAEFALTISIFLTIVLGIIEVGYLLYVYSTVFSAAREAARYGTAIGTNAAGVPHYKDCDSIKQAAIRIGGAVGVNAANTEIRYDKGPTDPHANWANVPSYWLALPTCGSYEPDLGDRVVVRIILPYKSLTGIIPSTTVSNSDARTVVKSVEVSGNFPPAPDVPLPSVPGPTDLIMTKTVDLLEFRPGDTLVYTLTVFNNGPSDANDVTITDTLPSQVDYVSSSLPPAVSGSTYTWDVGTVMNNKAYAVTLTVRVKAGVNASFSNTATVATSTVDTNSADNSSTANIIPKPPETDLSIIKTVNLPQVNAGDTLVYNLMVINNGPDPAQGVSVVDTLPSQVQYLGADLIPTVSGSQYTFSLGTLATGATSTFTITTKAKTGLTGGFTNTARVSSTTIETDSTDNTSTASSSFQTPITNLSINKYVNMAQFGSGDALVYTMKVTNTGTLDAQNVRINDTLPAQVTYLTANPAPVNTASVPLTWNLGVIRPTEVKTVTLTVKVNSGVMTAISNTATVVSDTQDSNAADNSSTVTSTLKPTDLSIIKTVNLAEFGPGDTLVYTIKVINDGQSDAAAGVADTLPAQVTYVSSTLDGAAVTPTIVSGATTWNLGTVLAHTNRTITLTTKVNANVRTPITNTASFTASTIDSNASNNTSSVTSRPLPVSCADLVWTDISQRNSNKYSLIWSNNNPTYDATITDLGVSWDSNNKPLEKIYFGNSTIWIGPATSFPVVPLGGTRTWASGANLILPHGGGSTSKTLTFEFASNYNVGLTSLWIQFQIGPDPNYICTLVPPV